MKLVVQIPCFNEQETLPSVLAEIPRSIPGIDSVEVLVIDDGSTDRTADVARECGADHVISSRRNRGLARSFRAGMDAALRMGADIVVNTDGDGQYPGREIPRLIQPIVDGEADIVIGDRQTADVAGFSWSKRLMQRIGSAAVARLSDLEIPDAVSGFRAFSRKSALDMNIVSTFSYTIETLIQAGRKHYAVKAVPIQVNPVTRPSRLFRSIPQFLAKSGATMLRIYAMYQPLRLYFYFGVTMMFIGSIPLLRFLFFYLAGSGEGKIQSLIAGAILIILGGLSLMFGLLADLINFNRQLAEMSLERIRRIESRLLGDEATTGGTRPDRQQKETDQSV
ncbi:MAG: glycosyltransferase family 2 protein [Gammaproteobacteria bacterium]